MLPKLTVTEPTQHDYARILGSLERTFQRQGEIVRQGPVPGSRAARDGRTALGRMAWDLAAPAGAIGLDHLLAWRTLRLKAMNQPLFAHVTLLRGAIEGAAIVRWLCDPGVDSVERMRRAAGLQLADYDQRLRFERRLASQLNKPTGRARTAAQRIDTLEGLLRKRKAKPIAMPSATDLFARYALVADDEGLAGEGLYRLISSLAHAKQWALLGLTQREGTEPQDGGRYAVQMSASPRLAFGLTAVAMHVATDAMGDFEWYGTARR